MAFQMDGEAHREAREPIVLEVGSCWRSIKPPACRPTRLNWTELNGSVPSRRATCGVPRRDATELNWTERFRSVASRDMRGPATRRNWIYTKMLVLDSCELLRPSSWKRSIKLGHDVTIHETSSTSHHCRLAVHNCKTFFFIFQHTEHKHIIIMYR